MASKRKRRTKHRGNAAGMVESRGRTGRKPTAADRKAAARKGRMDRFSKPRTVRSALQRSGDRGRRLRRRDDPRRPPESIAGVVALGGFVLLFYVPLSYYTDLFFYRRRQAKELGQGKR